MLLTVGPDIKVPGVVATELAGIEGVRTAIVKDPVGKGTLVVTLGKLLSMRTDPLEEVGCALGRTDDCVMRSADEESLLPEVYEPIGEEKATFGITGV